MRGEDRQQEETFLYATLEDLVPPDHPLRPIRAMVDRALKALDGRLDEIYGEGGRPSIAPERLLRAQLLMLLYSIRSERMLVEQLRYNLLFRWFVGLGMNEEVWHATVFTENRDRLREGEGGTGVLRRGGAAGAAAGADVERAFLGRRDDAGGVGEPEELPAEAGRVNRKGTGLGWAEP